jgi:hypothetical protein
MAYITVTADQPNGGRDAVTLTERVVPRDLESDHFSAQLIERLGWALVDAEDINREVAPSR